MTPVKTMGRILQVFVLLAGLMIWQSKEAAAHGLHESSPVKQVFSQIPEQPVPLSSLNEIASGTTVRLEQTHVVSIAPDDSSTKNCEGGCCSVMTCCVTAGALPQQPPVPTPPARADIAALPQALLFRNAPSSLLRPPRFPS